ncbi:unnamed protein product [Wickerhamomyces anomalus]
MSSNLFKQIPFARVPLVRYSVASKRFNKAEVQLLKDFPSVGLLLNIPKDNSKASSRIQPSKASYSLFNLSVNLGDLKFKVQEEDGSLKTPIDKSAIAAQIKKMVNISVPESDITLKIKRDIISEITKTGEYRLEIGTSEKATKKIFVDAEL